MRNFHIVKEKLEILTRDLIEKYDSAGKVTREVDFETAELPSLAWYLQRLTDKGRLQSGPSLFGSKVSWSFIGDCYFIREIRNRQVHKRRDKPRLEESLADATVLLRFISDLEPLVQERELLLEATKLIDDDFQRLLSETAESYGSSYDQPDSPEWADLPDEPEEPEEPEEPSQLDAIHTTVANRILPEILDLRERQEDIADVLNDLQKVLDQAIRRDFEDPTSDPIDDSDLPPFPKDDLPVTTSRDSEASPIDKITARQLLIRLRADIWQETNTGPDKRGILKSSLIDKYIANRVRSDKEFYANLSDWEKENIFKSHLPYLDQIYTIIERISPDKD